MVALGDCETLGQYHHITINELTTIAAAYALQGFMTGPANIGAPSTNLTGLRNAFNSASMVVNPYYGQVPGLLPAGATENQSEINTLADILVSCVNSSDGSGNAASGPCNTLFGYTQNSSGVSPTDTGTAAVNMAQHPGTNVSQLIAQSGSYQPFTPTLTSANDLTIAIRYTGTSINAPVGVAADQSGNVWIASTGSGTNANVTELTVPSVASSTFVSPTITAYASGSTGSSGALAIDLSGNAWTGSSSSNSIIEISSSGTVTPYTIGGVGSISSIAADGSGYVWATGSGNAVNAVASSNGAALSTTGFTGGGASNAQSIAITPH
jgi:streptogramin lyase